MLAAAIVVFVAAPRLGLHTALQPVQPKRATSGFSDRVELGSFARALDPTVALRVEPTDPSIEPARLRRMLVGRYWRGAVLSHFDGHGWRRARAGVHARAAPRRSLRIAPGEATIGLFVYREPFDHRYLPWPEGTRAVLQPPVALAYTTLGELRFSRPPPRRLRLRLALGATTPPRRLRPPIPAESSLAHVSPAVRNWAARWRARPLAEALAAIEDEMRGWRYTLDARPDPRDPIGWFLAHRAGHCELYASAFALIARVLGAPSRVVNGYRGGEWNDVGGFWTIRQQHAHSWVEVWLDGRWRRFDPTPPSRWSLSGVRFPAWDEAWDALRLAWYRYVLEFQDTDRARLLDALADGLRLGVPLIAAALLALATMRLSRRRAAIELGLIDIWLTRRGVRRPRGVPLREVRPAHVSPAAWDAFVADWERARYRPPGRFGLIRLLRRLFALGR